MYDIESAFERQILASSTVRPIVVFTEATDPRILEALVPLVRFVRPVLLASEEDVRAALSRELSGISSDRLEFALGDCAFVDPAKSSELVQKFAAEYAKLPSVQKRNLTSEQLLAEVSSPGLFGILAVSLGHADIVVGGAALSPRQYYRPMIDLLKVDDFCCETGIFVLPDTHTPDCYPHNIVAFGDVGVNAELTPELLAKIAVSTCVVAREIIPNDLVETIRGVLVSYSHNGADDEPSPELVNKASTLAAEIASERSQSEDIYKSIALKGAVKASVALSARAAVYHSQDGASWDGAPSVIICPNLEMGNMLYYLYAYSYPDSKHFTVMYGLDSRGVSLASDCTSEDVRLAVKATLLRRLQHSSGASVASETFFKRPLVLVINPGSTTTKISVYRGEDELFVKEIPHLPADLAPFAGKPVSTQFNFRKEMIMISLRENGIDPGEIVAIAGRGGLTAPIPHGTYLVNKRMNDELLEAKHGDHACNLGAIIGYAMSQDLGIPAYIVDPGIVDEMEMRARLTGIKEMPRRTVWHALNQLAVARRYASDNETLYDKLNLIVCHMGGGVSYAAHYHGRTVDANNALEGEGPFSPERAGTLPRGPLIDLCFSGKYTHAEMKRLIRGAGGMISYVGTSNFKEIEDRMQAGEEEFVTIFEAFSYQVAKAIASLIPAFNGEPIDQIILTGGMARSKCLISKISHYLSWLNVGVTVYPGEHEMKALATGVLRVLYGREKALQYPPEV
ncbi:butyrate kinase [bacterium]|nr:butyrate kinase [bacterium]